VCEARRALDGGAAREGQHRMHSERGGVAGQRGTHGLRDVEARGEGVGALRECAAGGARYQGELRLTEWVGHALDACGARDDGDRRVAETVCAELQAERRCFEHQTCCGCGAVSRVR